jgi:hypothetical protein
MHNSKIRWSFWIPEKMKKKKNIHNVCIKSWNHDTQMIIPFNISERESLKSFFMEKLSKIVLLQTWTDFWKTTWVYWSFANHYLKMDLIHTWRILLFTFIYRQKFKITTICSNFTSQRAVKTWIIANCIEFII